MRSRFRNTKLATGIAPTLGRHPVRRRFAVLSLEDHSRGPAGLHADQPRHRFFPVPDLIHYCDRLVFPYAPRLIVLHVGGNDVHNGRTPAQVLADFQSFVQRCAPGCRRCRSSTRALRPGPAAGTRRHSGAVANRAIQAYIATQPDLDFVDLWDAMLTAGRPAA